MGIPMSDDTQGFAGLMKEVAAQQRSELRRMGLTAQVQRRLATGAPSGDSSRKRHRRRSFMLFGAVAFGAAAVLAVVIRRPAPLSYALALGDSARPGQTGELLAASGGRTLAANFSDGSRVVLADQALARVEALDVDGATVALDEGRLEASIVHRAHTRWQIRAGEYRVRVTGTRFLTAWSRASGALTVQLFEGSVIVTGPGIAPAGARVSTGQVLHATMRGAELASAVSVPVDPGAEEGSAEAPAAATVASAARAVSPPPADEAPGPEIAPAPAPPSEPAAVALRPSRRSPAVSPAARAAGDWRALAAHARYRDALASAITAGFDAQCERLDADDLLLLADIARLNGDVWRAGEAYRAALRRFPSADRPTFGLGVMSFETRHDYRDAASWFSRYLREHPNGPLATEAAGRLVESWQRAGDAERARDAARAYLHDHPRGPHAALARRLVESTP
jgi:ferric-dicitrate binding protein FerR (iron transport regulator)/TolA-binding protein